jgi:hypothetical protein
VAQARLDEARAAADAAIKALDGLRGGK